MKIDHNGGDGATHSYAIKTIAMSAFCVSVLSILFCSSAICCIFSHGRRSAFPIRFYNFYYSEQPKQMNGTERREKKYSSKEDNNACHRKGTNDE